MRRMIGRTAAAVLGLLASPAIAGVDDDAELWTNVEASAKLGGRLRGQANAIMRVSEDDDGVYETQFGGFVGYQATDRIALWVGYLHNPRYDRDGPTIIEHRTRQQITADLGKVAGGSLKGRARLEQRFRNGSSGTGWRLRSQIKFSRPLVADGPAFVASHENFVAFNDTGWGQRSGFDRMRNFAGLSLPFAKRVKAEVGYLNQYARRPGDDAMDHVGSVSLGYAF